MAARVAALVPGLEGRANIGTFHAFCTQVLRQHGIHSGIKSSFTIYSRIEDRQAVPEDAFRRDHEQNWSQESTRLLPLIDHLKSRLVEPDGAERHIEAMNGSAAEDAGRVARAYRLYEEELRRINALDFNSLILDAYRPFACPAMARQYQRVYRYWLSAASSTRTGRRLPTSQRKSRAWTARPVAEPRCWRETDSFWKRCEMPSQPRTSPRGPRCVATISCLRRCAGSSPA